MTEDAWYLSSKQRIQGEINPPRLPPPQPSTCLRGMLSLANGPQTFYKNLTWQTKGRHDECTDSPRARLTDSTTLLQHPPPPPRDWYGVPFPTHGELAQGLSLTMRPTRTASSLGFFSPQWPETWLSPGSCNQCSSHLTAGNGLKVYWT